jgi:hypothetical protein
LNPEVSYFWTFQRKKRGGTEPSLWYSMFGLKLTTLRAVQLEDALREGAIQGNIKRQVDFINALYDEDRSRAFEIRHISFPRPEIPSAGEIHTLLFAKSSGKTEKGARANATGLFRELSPLLHGMFDDYMFMPLEEKREFDRFRSPFSVRYASEVLRRFDRFDLAGLKERPSLQPFRPGAARIPGSEAVHFIYPFVPTLATLASVFRIMLLLPDPIMVSASICPTRLMPQEEEALNREIAKCECLERTTNAISPIYQRRAAALARAMEGQMARLMDAPFFLKMQASSPAPIPRIFLESLGVEITSFQRPGPFHEEIVTAGYDIETPATRTAQIRSIENLYFLEFKESAPLPLPKYLQRIVHLVDAKEANCGFRLPIAINNDIPGLDTRRVRFVPVPKEISEPPDGKSLFLGINTHMGRKHPVSIPEQDRFLHMYCVGQTGTGKTTLLKTMALHDICQKEGVIIIDPHGDLYKELVGLIPKERWDDVVLLNPTDTDYPIGLNLLESAGEEEKYYVVREMKSIIERLLVDQYQGHGVSMMGPVFFRHVQMNMLLTMSNPDDPGTLVEFAETFNRDDYWRKWLPLRSSDPQLRTWVEKSLKTQSYETISRDVGIPVGDYFSSKFTDFFLDPKLRLIFGQKRSTIDVGKIMDEGKILLVNLAKGELTEANSRFLGMVLMAKIMAAAMGRIRQPVESRRPCYLYVDEFQNLATSSFSIILSEARKFGLGLILANQFLSQISDVNIINAIFGNVGTQIAFRVGHEDAVKLEAQYFPVFDRHHLVNIPNWEACVKATVRGGIVHPFSLKTSLPPLRYEAGTAAEVAKRSRFRYGVPRAKVEAEIERSLAFGRS